MCACFFILFSWLELCGSLFLLVFCEQLVAVLCISVLDAFFSCNKNFNNGLVLIFVNISAWTSFFVRIIFDLLIGDVN